MDLKIIGVLYSRFIKRSPQLSGHVGFSPLEKSISPHHMQIPFFSVKNLDFVLTIYIFLFPFPFFGSNPLVA